MNIMEIQMQKKKKFHVENKGRMGKTWNIEYKIQFFKPINCHETCCMFYSSKHAVCSTAQNTLYVLQLKNTPF
jgi:hypothetical protein